VVGFFDRELLGDGWSSEREGDRCVERQLAAGGATPLELGAGGSADTGFALPAVTSPAPERRDRVGLLDRAPEEAGVLALSSLGGHAREEADSEDTARAVAELVRDCK
jgi:hypothetical protein